MDPQHRQLLLSCAAVLPRRGRASAAPRGQDLGVYVALSHHEYKNEVYDDPALWPHPALVTATAASVAAGRVSYVYGLTGAALTIDTACSSALVAVHVACEGMQRGDTQGTHSLPRKRRAGMAGAGAGASAGAGCLGSRARVTGSIPALPMCVLYVALRCGGSMTGCF